MVGLYDIAAGTAGWNVRALAGLTLALAGLCGGTAAAQVQPADPRHTATPAMSTGPAQAIAQCPVAGTLLLPDMAALDRFHALAGCRAQAVTRPPASMPVRPAPVALDGKAEGGTPVPAGESSGTVRTHDDAAEARAAAPLAQPAALPATAMLATAAALPDAIVRLRPVVAELDESDGEPATAETLAASILAFAPRSYRTPHDPLIAATARRHGIDPLLLHAIVRQESNYGAAARSRAGAIGLMQIMPATGARFGHRAALLADPASNLDAGARLLRALHARYGNRFDLILAAYNAGEGAVARYGNRVPPFRETRDYVRLVSGHYAALAAQNGQLSATRF